MVLFLPASFCLVCKVCLTRVLSLLNSGDPMLIQTAYCPLCHGKGPFTFALIHKKMLSLTSAVSLKNSTSSCLAKGRCCQPNLNRTAFQLLLLLHLVDGWQWELLSCQHLVSARTQSMWCWCFFWMNWFHWYFISTQWYSEGETKESGSKPWCGWHWCLSFSEDVIMTKQHCASWVTLSTKRVCPFQIYRKSWSTGSMSWQRKKLKCFIHSFGGNICGKS